MVIMGFVCVIVGVCCSLYLDEREKMLVVLHLSACELHIVFLLPTVMLVTRKALMELGTKKIKDI